MTGRSSGDLEAILRCPQCHGAIQTHSTGWECGDCLANGPRILGILDLIPRRDARPALLAVAGGGFFDLNDDHMLAVRLAEHISEGFASLFDRWREAQSQRSGVLTGRGAERYRRKYARVEAEASDRHGTAIIDKVDAYLESTGLAGLGGAWALEAGGGIGKFLGGFRSRFSHVAFVDCSLANLVLARQLAEEQELDNILWLRADVTALPFAKGQFGFVHQNGVIEHVHDPVAMVQEAVRTTAEEGFYMCLSPNKYPLTPEPHFQLPLFGAIPRNVRRWLTRHTRGAISEQGTDLLSLRRLRRVFAEAGMDDVDPFFLPPKMRSIARRTPLRRVVQALLNRPLLGKVTRDLANGPALAVMPYHIAVCKGRSR